MLALSFGMAQQVVLFLRELDEMNIGQITSSDDLRQSCQSIMSLIQKGLFSEAEQQAHRVTLAQPAFLEGWTLLGLASFKNRKPDKAVTALRQALKLDPKNAETLNNLGAALNANGDHEAAIKCLASALSLKPNYAEAVINLGGSYQKLSKPNEAAKCYRKILELCPNDAKVLIRMGNNLKNLGDFHGSIKLLRRVLAISPKHAPTWNDLGILYRMLKQFEEAIECYQKAIEFLPNEPGAYSNYGNLLRDLERPVEAVEQQRKAVALSPQNPYLINNLGIALKESGQLDEAIECFEKAFSIDSDYHITQLSIGVVSLAKGDFSRGWRLYENRRIDQPQDYKKFDRSKEWQGEDLSGKKILIHEEQGLGDAIQFIRFVDLLKKQGGVVSFSIPSKMERLLRTYGEDLNLLSKQEVHEIAAQFDFHAYMMSLPLRLDVNDAGAIPSSASYLSAESELIEKWGDRIGKNGYKIGINWQGNSRGDIDNGRSTQLECFRPLAELPDVRLISLQKQGGVQQLESLPADLAVEHFNDEIDSGDDAFVDTAAIMSSLDLVVTTDTSIAHLAGALGIPVWVALKKVPDWRWGVSEDRTPWYPSMRLFRQLEFGEWDAVFESMAETLRSERNR